MTRALTDQAKARCILHSQNAKATHALTDQHPVHPADSNDFQI